MKRFTAYSTLVDLLSRRPVDDSCIPWPMARSPKGYGTIYFNGKCARVHRIAYEITSGEIPEGLVVCHKCDSRAYVRPSHLFIGTQAENNRDRTTKGRGAYGQRSGRAKMTDEDVRNARRDGAKPIDLVRRYGINSGTASRALNGRTWRHLGAAQ